MMTTSSRLLALLSLLQARRTWPGEALAERLGVTTRTVRRDVDRLRELDYRINAIKGPDGGYRLDAGAQLPPMLFDDEQAVALAVALRSAAAGGVEIGEAAQRALATVAQLMPSRLRHRIDAVQFTGTAGPASVEPAVLVTVSDAVARRMTLRFDDARADGPPRRVQPYEIVARGGRWYLVAWDLDRADWRIFRLDRMTPRTPLGPPFEPRPLPTGDAATFLAARFKGSGSEDRWPCVGTFEIDLPVARVAPWVREGRVVAVGEERSRVTAGSWSWAGMLAEVLRFEAPFRLLEPPELLAASRTAARRLHEAGSPAGADPASPTGATAPIDPRRGRDHHETGHAAR